jgi:hypothetical protein
MKQRDRPLQKTQTSSVGRSLDDLFALMQQIDQRLAGVEQAVTTLMPLPLQHLLQRLEGQVIGHKQWYTTTELAEAMKVSQYTVQEHWCNHGRIDCQKDPVSGQWRIPGREFRRLVKGGALKPRKK